MTAPTDNYAFVLAVQGEAKPLSIEAPAESDVSALLAAVRAQTGRDDLVELLWEDIDEAIDEAERVAERLEKDFRLIHAAAGGEVELKIHYDRQEKEHDFRPSATIRRVIAWAISPEGFDLIGELADFQIKLAGRVVPPDTHVGQLGHAKGHIEVTLVHNIKPQG